MDRSEHIKRTEPGANLVQELNPEALDVAKRLEWQLYSDSQIPDNNQLIYSREEESRLGVPIVMLPQRLDKHEHEVLTHMLLASWAATKFRQVLIPRHTHYLVEAEFENMSEDDLAAFAIAAYLHDLDKVFGKRRPFNPVKPYIKASEPHSQIKTDGPSEISARIIPERLKERVRQLLEVYSIIDKAIIEGASRPDFGIRVSNIIKETANLPYDRKIKYLGVLLMRADNYAQGNPSAFRNTESDLVKFNEDQQHLDMITEMVLFELALHDAYFDSVRGISNE